MHARGVVRCACAGIVLIGASAAAQQPQRTQQQSLTDPAAFVDIIARPVRDGLGNVEYIEVRQQFSRGPGASAAEFLVRLPGGPPITDGTPRRAPRIVVEDADGPVPVQTGGTPSGSPSVGGGRGGRGGGWRAQRPVRYPVTVTYEVALWPPGTRTNPSYMARGADGAVSAQGTGLFLSAGDGVVYDSARFRWDLTGLAPGSITASGITDENDVRGSLFRLMNTFYMAGPLQRYPAHGDRDGFAAYWMGTPAWDAARVMTQAAQMYEYMRKFHRDAGSRRYRVLGRMIPPPAYGGQAFPGHFIFNDTAAPRDSANPGPILLLAHEIGHNFVRGIQNPGGAGASSNWFREGGANNWFSEGLNEYYAVMLSLRSGIVPIDLVLTQMNRQTRNYYTSPRINMPADSVAMANPMTDGLAQNISYERGLLFWADLNHRIRAATDGRRNLDSVLVPMMARARATLDSLGGLAPPGELPGWFTPDQVVEAFVKELGPTARERFETIIFRGETIVPASQAFGPCFELKPVRFPARSSRNAPPASAGPSEVEGYTWVRVPSIPDARCHTW